VDAAEILHPDSSHPVSHEKIRDIIGSRSPVLWIGGSEPLHHPGIAHLVRAITQSGHFVFSKPLELFSAAASMSFNRCRGSF